MIPEHDCARCPRLAEFRAANTQAFPEFHNAPVASFGPLDARLLVVGLAPGLKGANRTGRPFTGDYAGDLLYPTLTRYGFAAGRYGAVRCVPPANKPVGIEIRNCRMFLEAEIAAMPRLNVIVALGLVAHNATLAALGLRQSHSRFAHGARSVLPNGILLADSYHCSRYNTNTGRLTEAMFHAVFDGVRSDLDRKAP